MDEFYDYFHCVFGHDKYGDPASIYSSSTNDEFQCNHSEFITLSGSSSLFAKHGSCSDGPTTISGFGSNNINAPINPDEPSTSGYGNGCATQDKEPSRYDLDLTTELLKDCTLDNGDKSFMDLTEDELFYDFTNYNDDAAKSDEEDLRMAMDFDSLRNILRVRSKSRKEIDRVIFILRGHYSMLMITKPWNSLFERILNECNKKQLDFIAREILARDDAFVSATFSKLGKNSVMKFIKRTKKLDYAFIVTKILSTRFWDIMTHGRAGAVIQQCLIYLGNEANQILYEKAIFYACALVEHTIGSRCLFDFISVATGAGGAKLFDCISDASCYLATHKFGNYALKAALERQEPLSTEKILIRLTGRFVHLSQRKEGSHVVEACMNCSTIGTITVINEIISTPDAPVMLANHQFGNYVIQRALCRTKKNWLVGNLYDHLVECLEPHRRVMETTPGGRRVIGLLS